MRAEPDSASELSFVSAKLMTSKPESEYRQPHARYHSLTMPSYLIRHASNRVQQSLRAKSRVRLEHDMAAE